MGVRSVSSGALPIVGSGSGGGSGSVLMVGVDDAVLFCSVLGIVAFRHHSDILLASSSVIVAEAALRVTSIVLFISSSNK